jgi:hypothetical protein
MSVNTATQQALTMNRVEDLNSTSSGGFDTPLLREGDLSLMLRFATQGFSWKWA